MSDAEKRAAARRSWPVRRFALGSEPSENLSTTTTAEERLAMMWPLAKEAWMLAHGEIPDLPRDQWPVRCFRRIAKPAIPRSRKRSP